MKKYFIIGIISIFLMLLVVDLTTPQYGFFAKVNAPKKSI